MTATIFVCDKDSSAGYSKTFVFKDKKEFLAQWEEFKAEVPFSRWYPEATSDDDATERLVEEWLEEA